MSVGYWRSLNGVPVRSLKILRHSPQANVRYPRELRRPRRLVASEPQCGQSTGQRVDQVTDEQLTIDADSAAREAAQLFPVGQRMNHLLPHQTKALAKQRFADFRQGEPEQAHDFGQARSKTARPKLRQVNLRVTHDLREKANVI